MIVNENDSLYSFYLSGGLHHALGLQNPDRGDTWLIENVPFESSKRDCGHAKSK
jgi:hypothetical protein